MNALSACRKASSRRQVREMSRGDITHEWKKGDRIYSKAGLGECVVIAVARKKFLTRLDHEAATGFGGAFESSPLPVGEQIVKVSRVFRDGSLHPQSRWYPSWQFMTMDEYLAEKAGA